MLEGAESASKRAMGANRGSPAQASRLLSKRLLRALTFASASPPAGRSALAVFPAAGEIAGFRIGLAMEGVVGWTGVETSEGLGASIWLYYCPTGDSCADMHRCGEKLGVPQMLVFPLFPGDLAALESSAVSSAELLRFKLFRRLFLNREEQENGFSLTSYAEFLRAQAQRDVQRARALSEVVHDLGDEFRGWIDHPMVHGIRQRLSKVPGCLLSGASASGKSVLALQVAHAFALGGAKVVYADLSRAPGFDSMLSEHVLDPEARPDLLVVDDLQSNPRLARYLTVVCALRDVAGSTKPPKLLSVCWPDFASSARNWWPSCPQVNVKPEQIRDAIVESYAQEVTLEIRESLCSRFGDDMLLLSLALARAKTTGENVQLKDVAEQVWAARTPVQYRQDPQAYVVALLASVLGTYDIPAPRQFLAGESAAPSATIDALETSRFLRRKGEALTPGHRSLCGLMAQWLDGQGAWESLRRAGGPGRPENVLFDYLKSLDSSATLTALRAMHARAGFRDQPELNARAVALVKVWSAFESVVENVEELHSVDPTWAKTPSSASFAAQAVAFVGEREKAMLGVDFLRGYWRLENGQLVLSTAGLATEEDFARIRDCMIEEDEGRPDSGQVRAEAIDIQKFHSTWLAGLILGAEAVATPPAVPLTELAESAERLALESGAFYPERVPWVTARVLLGLAACGRTMATSSVVADAVEWLLRSDLNGGANCDGLWRGGTGTWNSRLETTAMVLLALAKVGADMESPLVSRAHRFLLSERGDWAAPGRELEGALAIEALLESGGDWADVAEASQGLSAWARQETFWKEATVGSLASREQSCRVAQVAMHLINIGWKGIQADLPAFVDALSPPASLRQELRQLTATGRDSVHVDARTLEDSVSLLNRLERIDLGAMTVVGSYRRFDEAVRSDLKSWAAKIRLSLLGSTDTRENYLIWAAPGSGKTFFVQEIARELADRVRLIELNLARDSREAVNLSLESIRNASKPVLFLVDEVDARSTEKWPLEDIFPSLDVNSSSGSQVVFVLVGSEGGSRNDMENRLGQRSKGVDLVDRIPVTNRFDIPSLSLGDKIAMIAGGVSNTAAAAGTSISEIEKLAVLYLVCTGSGATSRQLSEAVKRAVKRVAFGETRLHYDDLFHSGDRANQEFYVHNRSQADQLLGRYVALMDPA
jgi:hypothetical protein